MSGDFMVGDLMSYVVQISDFLSGDFMFGDFLTGIQKTYVRAVAKILFISYRTLRAI